MMETQLLLSAAFLPAFLDNLNDIIVTLYLLDEVNKMRKLNFLLVIILILAILPMTGCSKKSAQQKPAGNSGDRAETQSSCGIEDLIDGA
jgi:hypothetical protein